MECKIIPVGRAKDIRGQKFGKLTVIDRVEKPSYLKSDKGTYWLCNCECSNSSIVYTNSLKSGATESCGCLRSEKIRDINFKDISGNQYGRWMVLNKNYVEKYTRYWLCQCECGTEKYVNSGSLVSGRTRSCGCYHAELISSWNGENSPSWNQNLTEEERNLRNNQSSKVKKWAYDIYKKDSFICQLCNKRGGNLNAHHLNAWNSHPDERFGIDNGVTLCTKCHTSFHKEYGYGDNTKEQFNDFIESVLV